MALFRPRLKSLRKYRTNGKKGKKDLPIYNIRDSIGQNKKKICICTKIKNQGNAKFGNKSGEARGVDVIAYIVFFREKVGLKESRVPFFLPPAD